MTVVMEGGGSSGRRRHRMNEKFDQEQLAYNN